MRNKASKHSANSVIPQLRVAGVDPSARAVMTLAAQHGNLPVVVAPSGDAEESDYAQIERGLDASISGAKSTEAPPSSGLGYAGLTPGQRHDFLLWLQSPVLPTYAAFRQLCVANLEVRLLESPEWASAARALLVTLDEAAAWEREERLSRALLLAFWLTQDGERLAAWIASGRTPVSLLGIALGCQALLGAPLRASQALIAAAAWNLSQSSAPPQVVALRLATLRESLGVEPLAYALVQMPPEARQPQLWRCAHRDLRISFPQPDVRPTLAHLLREVVQASDALPSAAQANGLAGLEEDADSLDATIIESSSWNLVLEFQESTSGFWQVALRRAQRMAGYRAIMDEHRRVLHRVRFGKEEMRSFWHLWEIVQSWTHTHVFLNGRELEKWKIYPYSQFLR